MSTLKLRLRGRPVAVAGGVDRADVERCGAPPPSVAVVNGVVHAAKAAPSTLHSNVPASVEVNVKVGVASLVGPFGPAVIVVSGATVSTRNVRVAAAERLPAGSVALAV